ncbi:hypothetical protein CKO31_22830 [Thiohalocapsa halophila]|uniref:histidine kinase n=2 Tax=Thiohalocapsa halophila TaxID=69359 RepID=A0ABS1CNK5_9GAMM|nr:hypothetical protein [Thiohalocapsa halophila]
MLLLLPVVAGVPALVGTGMLAPSLGLGLAATAAAVWIHVGAGLLLAPRRRLARRTQQLLTGPPPHADDWSRIDAGLQALGRQRDRHRVRIRELESRLHRAQAAADRADIARRAFLANVGHEIRTPMNVVVGMTRLALKLATAPRQQDLLLRADQAAHGLLTQINNLLDVVKLEAGELHLDRGAFALSEQLSQLVTTYARDAERKGIDLRLEQDPQLPPVLMGDADRLQQVLASLVDNALKFTDAGEIVIACRLSARSEGRARLGFEVRDTGIGIPLEQQEALFGLFRQGDTSLSRRHDGTGIGLGLCYRLVYAMGGTLELDSRPDLGSSFRFALDFAVPTPASQSAQETAPAPPAPNAEQAAAREHRRQTDTAPDANSTRIRVRGNERLLRRLMGRFRLDHGDFLADWRSLREAGDRFGAAQLARALESAAASLGALELRAAARRLALKRRADDDPTAELAEIAKLLDVLLAEIDQRLGEDGAEAAAAAPLASRTDAAGTAEGVRQGSQPRQVSVQAADQDADLERRRSNLGMEINHLAGLLAEFDAAAINAFESLRERLAGLVADDALNALQSAINGFDFATAGELVQELTEDLGIAEHHTN